MPADHPLLDYLLTVLAAVMTPALNDPALARKAAQQAIDAYQPQTTHELLATGQILAFALTALESLRLSAPEDVSPSMKLKLRANANGLNRSARDNTRLLEAKPPHPAWHTPEPPPPANPDWAGTMTRVAEKLGQNPPPAATTQHSVNALWIDTLKTVARDITPPKKRAALLQTTTLATDLPCHQPDISAITRKTAPHDRTDPDGQTRPRLHHRDRVGS
ncbi:hypothetical protein [Acidisphaera sp. S103]|uniref:hypothetical protein n=1 Tax=Acidisphaera sp. S103 TaxID=1747223 RepID=UPI00131E314A|nr:hypothetical protein [Acidisphaera sp. S103]